MTKPRKSLALVPGSTIAVVAPASSAKEERIQRGCETLESLDYRVKKYPVKGKPEGYFSAPLAERGKQLQSALTGPDIRAVFCSRVSNRPEYSADSVT
jgi:muramoyltetrapeptide carboxypeptidase LdcA involved in peptidoglycan recycling